MMTKLLGTIGIGLLAAGCWQSRSELVGPSTWQIECRRNRGKCYREASRRCPRGFTVLDGANHSGIYVSGSVAVPVYKGEMIVRCSDGATAGK